MHAKPQFRVTTACTLLALVAAARQCRALDPNQVDGSQLRKNFTIEDGLPANEVHAIVQTSNGFLWVATEGGLARFDGQHFTLIRFREGSQEIPVLSLLNTPDGDLWAGTDAGLEQIPRAAVDIYDRSLVKSYHPGVGLSDQILCIHLSRAGALWIGTSGGLYRMDRGSFVPVIDHDMISRIEESSDGHLLIITGHGFVEWDSRRVIPHPELASQLGVATDGIFTVFEDHRGVTWFCTSKGVARRVNGSVERLAPYGSPHGGAWRPYEDPQGNMWILAESGLFRASGTVLKPEALDVKPRSIYADRDGELWVGNGSEGLVRFKDRAIRMYTAADGLPNDTVLTVIVRHDGTLWTGNSCGGISRFDGRRFHYYNEKDGLSNSCVWALAEDNNHDLWIGTWGGGLYRFRDNHFTQYLPPQGLPSNVVTCIVAARDGSLWVATSAGLSHMENGRFRTYTVADGLSSDRIMTVYQDHTGGIWAGTSVGVDHLVGEHFVQFSGGLSTSNAPVSALREDSSGDIYAMSLVNGISRLQGNRLVRVNETLQTDNMVETSGSEFWFSGRKGIFRVAADDFKSAEQDRDGPLNYASFGRDDGLNSRECSFGQPNMAIGPDGSLWVATVKGLARLDPGKLRLTNHKPPIFMEEVDIGRARMVPGREVLIRPGTFHVEFHFTAVDLASPGNIHLQYRLDGVDPTWLDADSTRTAIYNSIPVGTHAFHIRACDSAGVWDRTGIAYTVTQQPFFYETIWFRLSVVGAVGLLMALIHKVRVRQVAAEVSARFDERLAERTRIARDFHDTLLQTIQGSKMVADDALDKSADAARMLKALQRLSVWLGQAMQEGRSALNSLRSSTTQGNDLAEALRRAGEECLVGRSMDFSVSVQGTSREIHPIVRDEVYRIGYEAIRNACLHSQGTQLAVELTYVANLRLAVRDNGIGIDRDVAVKGREGHYGVMGMYERASRIRGKLTISSAPDLGTELELVVPRYIIFQHLNPGQPGRLGRIRNLLSHRS